MDSTSILTHEACLTPPSPSPMLPTMQSLTRYHSFCLQRGVPCIQPFYIFFIFTGANLIQAHIIYDIKYLLQKYFPKLHDGPDQTTNVFYICHSILLSSKSKFTVL
jgi:hypothetical protein